MSASGGQGGCEDVTVLGVHLDGSDGGEITRVNLNERVLAAVVHQLLKPRGAVVAEAQVLAQIAGHLRQDLPAPVDLDGALVGGVDHVVAQRPGEQDVGVREHD
jgi:hypothetical protein